MDLITANSFGDGQKDRAANALGAFIQILCETAPQLGPHLLSGGVIDIKTISGAHIVLGFGPKPGGVIIPGGIRPAGQNGSVIK